MKETIKNTTNPYVYKKMHLNKHLKCPLCAPHRGCNANRKRERWRRNGGWKNHRRTQYKPKGD